MKKMQNLSLVLAAAALLALGTSSAFAAGWVQEGTEWRYQDNSGDYVTDTMKKSGDTTFYLDENGYMAKDYFCEYSGSGSTDNFYYFGSNGAMVKNTWVAVDPSVVSDNDDEDAEVLWYYFQENGKAFKAGDGKVSKKRIDGKDYWFNDKGQMRTGWFDNTGALLETEDDDEWFTFEPSSDAKKYYSGADGVARGGWLAWTDGLQEDVQVGDDNEVNDKTVLWFYFDPNNYVCFSAKGDGVDTKTINGKKYAFNNNGLMLSAWEYLEEGYGSAPTELGTASYNKYFSDETDGHMVKRGWIYAVPSAFIDEDDNEDDEEEYFYFNGNGEMQLSNQKKINGKYYIFDAKGIMKTGLILLGSSRDYFDAVDLDETSGEMVIKKGLYWSDNDDAETTLDLTSDYSIHYFGDDGAKVTGNNISIEFNDETYTFAANNNGGYTDIVKKKKYYSNGFLLKGSDDIKYAIAFDPADTTVTSNIRTEVSASDIFPEDLTAVTTELTSTAANKTIVLSSSGSKIKKGAKKDANGDYWLVDTTGHFAGVYSCDVRLSGGAFQYKTECQYVDASGAVDLSKDTKDKWAFFTGYTQYSDSAFATPVDSDTWVAKNVSDINKNRVKLTTDYCANFTVD